MNLTSRDVRNTKELRESMHARSNAEVVGNALSITTSLNDLLKKGGELLVRNKKGELERIHITALD